MCSLPKNNVYKSLFDIFMPPKLLFWRHNKIGPYVHLSICPFVCSTVRPCQLCPEHISYITLDRNTKFGTNVLIENAMCRMQDPGLNLKGQGHNLRSKVKKWDILPLGAFVIYCDPILVLVNISTG